LAVAQKQAHQQQIESLGPSIANLNKQIDKRQMNEEAKVAQRRIAATQDTIDR